jgi:hypothetical protein
MDPLTIASLLSALAAAFWTVWTWSADHKEQRQLERDQAAALYVNPYLLAIAELNKRLRGVLEGDDLARARRAHPGPHKLASPFALETLYVLAVNFAWANANLRYGPYTRDRVALASFRDIIMIFDRRDGFPDEAFRFSYPEQAALGAAVMRRVGTIGAAENMHSHGFVITRPEFAPITLHEFERDFASAEGPLAALHRGSSIRQVVEAIDGADRGEQLRGRERLAALRPVLTRLAQHLQAKERIALAAPEAMTASGPSSAGAGPAASPSTNGSGPRVLYRMRGRIRLRVPGLSEDEEYAASLGARIRAWDNVDEVSIDAPAGAIDIRYRPAPNDVEFRRRVLEAVAAAPHGNHRRPRARAAASSRRRRTSARGRS